MTNPRNHKSSRFGCILLLAIAVISCGEAEKSGEAMPDFGEVSAKAVLSEAVIAGEIATAMVNGVAERGQSSMSIGQTIQDALSSLDGTLDNGSYFDSWVFGLTGQADVTISLSSGDFDTYVALYRGTPSTLGDYLGGDDDGGNGTDSKLEISLGGGSYTVVARSYSAGATGAYGISISTMGGAGADRVLRAGGTQSGALSVDADTLLNGANYHDWYYTGDAGEQVTVSLTSSDFDTYLLLVRSGTVVGSNDDFSGTNSEVTVTLPSHGAYTVRVTSYAKGDFGSYSLSATSAGARPAFSGFRTGGDPNGRYALLVGVDHYVASNDLVGPVTDTRTMERVLVDRFGFDPDNVVILNDADATRRNIAQGVVQHLGQAGPDGVAVFFFAGHGTQIGENVGLTGSLDPEPRGKGDEAIVVYGYDGLSTVIVDEELGYLIESINAGRTLVVVDACFSGEITRAPSGGPQARALDLTDPRTADGVLIPSDFITSELRALNLDTGTLGFGDIERVAAVFSNPQRHLQWGAATEDQVSFSRLDDLGGVFTYALGERLMASTGTETFAQIHQLVHDDAVAYVSSQEGYQTMMNPQLRGPIQSMTLDAFFRQR